MTLSETGSKTSDPFVGPPHFEWPTFEGEPMTCTAQIDLTCLTDIPLWPGPTTGILTIFDAFFLFWDREPKNSETADVTLAKACHFQETEKLVEHAYPYEQDRAQEPGRTYELGLLQEAEVAPAQKFIEAQHPNREVAVILDELPNWLPFAAQLLGPADSNTSKSDPAAGIAHFHARGDLGELWDDADPNDWINFFRPHLADVQASRFTILQTDLVAGRFDRTWFDWEW